jgi:hypothetical protein
MRGESDVMENAPHVPNALPSAASVHGLSQCHQLGEVVWSRHWKERYKAWHWEELLNRLLDLAISIALALAIASAAIPARRQVYRPIRCTRIQTD